MGIHLVAGGPMSHKPCPPPPKPQNHLAKVVRSKPGRPALGENATYPPPPLFGPIRVPYLKG